MTTAKDVSPTSWGAVENPFSVFLQSEEEALPLTVFNMFPVNGGNACLKSCS